MVKAHEPQVRILLVDDDPADARRLARCLRSLARPHTIEYCARLGQADEALASQEFDLVFVDLLLPDSSGLVTVERLLACAGRTPVVALIGRADVELATAALEMGACDVLEKNQVCEDTVQRVVRHGARWRQAGNEIERLRDELQRTSELLRRKRRSLARLRKASRRRVRDAAHGIRTPLTVVKECALLMNDGLVGDVNERQQRLLNVIANRANELNQIVDGMENHICRGAVRSRI